MRHRIHLPISIVCALHAAVSAQDVEQSIANTKRAVREDPLKVNGSVGANAVAYTPFGIAPRRDPFYWVLNANLNVVLFNSVTVPFSAVVTQQDKNFTNGLDKFSQPFNQFGLSPRYKWLTVHAGYRMMEFSEYTMSGAMFLGGGIETNCEKSPVNFAAFSGRFVKAVPKGGVDGVVVSVPAYERWGSGGKIRIGNTTRWVEISAMRFTDDKFSIGYDTAALIAPKENELAGVRSRQPLGKRFIIEGEMVTSIFTRNTLEANLDKQSVFPQNLYTVRPSTRINKTVTGLISYQVSRGALGLRYKRIDPDYVSLGTVFLTNDIEEISMDGSASPFSSLNVSGSIGLQQNNLDKVQALTSRRVVGALNISWNAGSHLNFSGGYNSFSSNSIPVRDAFADTIRFVQLSQSSNLTTAYSFGNQSVPQSLVGSFSYQQSTGTQQQAVDFINGTAGYQFQIPAMGWQAAISTMYNRQTAADGATQGIGPAIVIGKSLLRGKVRLQLQQAIQGTYANQQPLSQNVTAQLGVNFQIDPKQSFHASGSFLKRIALQPGVIAFSELRTDFGYRYNFSATSKKKTTP